MGVEAPAPRKQTLPAKHFVNSGNAAAELVPCIEDSRVGVSDLSAARENRVQPRTVALRVMHGLQQFNGPARPHRPLPQQTAHKMRSPLSKPELGEQVGHDVVVVAGI